MFTVSSSRFGPAAPLCSAERHTPSLAPPHSSALPQRRRASNASQRALEAMRCGKECRTSRHLDLRMAPHWPLPHDGARAQVPERARSWLIQRRLFLRRCALLWVRTSLSHPAPAVPRVSCNILLSNSSSLPDFSAALRKLSSRVARPVAASLLPAPELTPEAVVGAVLESLRIADYPDEASPQYPTETTASSTAHVLFPAHACRCRELDCPFKSSNEVKFLPRRRGVGSALRSDSPSSGRSSLRLAASRPRCAP